MEEKQSIDFEANVKTIAVIDNNLQAFISEIEKRCEAYKDLKFTLETCGDAKKTRADLNNAIKSIEERRIALHKEYDKPYDEFAKAVKEAIKKIDDVKKPIEEQIASFELEQRKAKEKVILEIRQEILKEKNFSDDIKAFVDTISSSVITPEEYFNVGYTENKIKKELTAYYDQIATDYKTISNLCSKDNMLKVTAFDIYSDDYTMGAGKAIDLAIQENNKRIELSKKVGIETLCSPEISVEIDTTLPKKVKHLWFKLNKDQFNILLNYCKELGIEYSDKEITE